MPTLVLDAYSKAYPFIVNRIRAAIYVQSSPQAFVAEIIDVTAGHPARIWHFPGLPRNNYGFTLDEIDGGGIVVANLASFAVVPGTIDGFLTRAEEQIRVDVTPGLVSGQQVFVFDGTTVTTETRATAFYYNSGSLLGIPIGSLLEMKVDEPAGTVTIATYNTVSGDNNAVTLASHLNAAINAATGTSGYSSVLDTNITPNDAIRVTAKSGLGATINGQAFWVFFGFSGSGANFSGGVTGAAAGAKPNYIGWDIVPSEIDGGRGILVKGQDYSWDKLTATFTLLQVGDVFQTLQYYNIHFEPSVNPAGNSFPTVRDFTIRFIDADANILSADFGNKVIIEPAGVYAEMTLPDIATVVEGRPLLIEVGGVGIKCVKFITFGANIIKFLRGNLYMMSGESCWLYKFTRSVGNDEWRVSEACGNFKTVGESVADDMIQASVFNKQLLDGTTALITQYARIYNEIVLNLPNTQRVNFDAWVTGNNKYFYSLANSANPANAGKFKFPDRRGLFYRNNNVGKAGDYADDSLKPHTHNLKVVRQNTEGGNRFGFVPNNNGAGSQEWNALTDNGGLTATETAPKHILINQFVLL